MSLNVLNGLFTLGNKHMAHSLCFEAAVDLFSVAIYVRDEKKKILIEKEIACIVTESHYLKKIELT